MAKLHTEVGLRDTIQNENFRKLTSWRKVSLVPQKINN